MPTELRVAVVLITAAHQGCLVSILLIEDEPLLLLKVPLHPRQAILLCLRHQPLQHHHLLLIPLPVHLPVRLQARGRLLLELEGHELFLIVLVLCRGRSRRVSTMLTANVLLQILRIVHFLHIKLYLTTSNTNIIFTHSLNWPAAIPAPQSRALALTPPPLLAAPAPASAVPLILLGRLEEVGQFEVLVLPRTRIPAQILGK